MGVVSGSWPYTLLFGKSACSYFVFFKKENSASPMRNGVVIVAHDALDQSYPFGGFEDIAFLLFRPDMSRKPVAISKTKEW
jgi:hypothetical protein